MNLSFTLEPRTVNGLQIPLDNECAVKIRTAFNEKIADYRSKFYVNPTFTCPTRLQLQSPVLTFQEPVILCLSGEPVRDENGILSCLVSQGKLGLYSVCQLECLHLVLYNLY